MTFLKIEFWTHHYDIFAVIKIFFFGFFHQERDDIFVPKISNYNDVNCTLLQNLKCKHYLPEDTRRIEEESHKTVRPCEIDLAY